MYLHSKCLKDSGNRCKVKTKVKNSSSLDSLGWAVVDMDKIIHQSTSSFRRKDIPSPLLSKRNFNRVSRPTDAAYTLARKAQLFFWDLLFWGGSTEHKIHIKYMATILRTGLVQYLNFITKFLAARWVASNSSVKFIFLDKSPLSLLTAIPGISLEDYLLCPNRQLLH